MMKRYVFAVAFALALTSGTPALAQLAPANKDTGDPGQVTYRFYTAEGDTRR